MATHPITYYFDSPATRALSEKYGSMLEKLLTAKDKLDALWVIVTSIGFSEKQGEMVSLKATQDEFGSIMPDAQHAEEFLRIVDNANPGVPDLLAISRILAKHLHEGDYVSE
jgi:hypothetical protein